MDVCRYVHGRSGRHLIPTKGLSHLLGMMGSLVIFKIVDSRFNDLGVDIKQI
jgi:hypothetical protein